MMTTAERRFISSRVQEPEHPGWKSVAAVAALALAAYGLFDQVDRELTLSPISSAHAASPAPARVSGWFSDIYYRFPDDVIYQPEAPASTL